MCLAVSVCVLLFVHVCLPLSSQKRYHILDSAAQRQKAHLSHGKGLQNRRLPSQFAGKVSDDYHDKRKDFDPLMASNLTVIPEDGGRADGQTHDGLRLDDSTSPLNDEEREQHVRSGFVTLKCMYTLVLVAGGMGWDVFET